MASEGINCDKTNQSNEAHHAASNVAKSTKWTIRPMKLEDIDKCLEIWNKVNLTEAYQTVASELRFDPKGFYVAEIDSTGEVVGMCAGPLTRTDTAFMGFYAVDPTYQGSGIGRELWAKTTGRLDSSANIGLYGVPSMSAKYKKSGFALEDTIKLLIHESEAYLENELRLDKLCNIDQLRGCQLVTLTGREDDTYKKIVEYDANVNRFSRESLLKEYLLGSNIPLTLAVVKSVARKQSSPATTGCCTTTTQNQAEDLRSAHELDEAYKVHPDKKECAGRTQVVGYGCIRHDNTSGGMVGPIYADSSEICEVILKNLLKQFELQPGGKYSVMALSSNKQASEIASKLGLKEVDQCSRMFTKFIPTASYSQVYYIHSPNFTLF